LTTWSVCGNIYLCAKFELIRTYVAKVTTLRVYLKSKFYGFHGAS